MVDKLFLHNIKNLKFSGNKSNNTNIGKTSDIELFPARIGEKVDLYSVNLDKIPQNDIPPQRLKELENWKLDWELYVDADDIEKENEMCDYHFEHKKEILDIYNGWYQEYLAKHNGEEMNFMTAMQYLKDNPNEDESIKEFIKKSFGICDGEVSKNQQMGKGSCHLLSCRGELDDSDDAELQEIARNIVKQNEDGTVTVTFAGIKDEEGKSLQFTIKNEEIKDSYTKFDKSTGYIGGSTDPDNAALELGYEKLKDFLAKNCPTDYKERVDEIDNKINENTWNSGYFLETKFKIIDKVFIKEYSKILAQLKVSDKQEDKELLDFIVENAEGNENDARYVQNLMRTNLASDTLTSATYNYFDEKSQTNKSGKMPINWLMQSKIIELIQNDPEYADLNNEYKEIEEQLSVLEKEAKQLREEQENNSELYALSNLWDEKEWGLSPKLTFKLLTGKGKYIKSLAGQEMYNYLETHKDNLEKIPIVVDENILRHAFMFDKAVTNKFGDVTGVVISNPHNENTDKEDNDSLTIAGNIEKTSTISIDNFMNFYRYGIVIIDKEPDESKENYITLPLKFETY